MTDNNLTIDEIIALGNTEAPEEWLAAFTGEGIGNGYEGIDEDIIQMLMDEDDSNDPLMPVLPIEATPEIQFYQCRSTNYTKGRGGNKPQNILVHFTSGKKTSAGAALANCKYFGREKTGASAHFFIDDGYTIWQSVSENDTAWHAGNWAMNQRSIGIEVCSAGVFTENEIQRLTWLVQHLMAKYNIPASRVIRHYDVTKKRCPAYYVDSSKWKQLHSRITGGKISDSATKPPSKPQSKPQSKPNSTYTGNSIVEYLDSINKPSDFNSRKKYASQYGISNYKGTESQNLKLLNLMRKGSVPKPSTSTSYYKAFTSNSIIDGLEKIGVNSSFSNRKKIAKANGIHNYSGTSSQNNRLCALAKAGKLRKA